MEPWRLSKRALIVAMSLMAPRRLARLFIEPPVREPREGELESSGRVERISFPATGGVACRGLWVTPQGAPSDTCVILAHGWTSNATRMWHFVEPLVAKGFQVMLYDARSHGESDHYHRCSMLQFTEDARAAVRYARERVGHVAMVGHSMGAAATLVAAAEGEPIEAAVALAPPSHPRLGSRDLLHALGTPADLIMSRISHHVEAYLGRAFHSFAPEVRVADIRCPVLLMHGTQDEVVPIAHFHRIRANSGPQVESHEMAGMDHDQIKLADEVVARVVSFLNRTLLDIAL